MLFSLGPPVIVSSAPNGKIVAGHSITLRCGHSHQKIFWYKEGSDMHFESGHTLVIQDASSKDEGTYHCAVGNGPKGSLKVLVIGRCFHIRPSSCQAKCSILSASPRDNDYANLAPGPSPGSKWRG